MVRFVSWLVNRILECGGWYLADKCRLISLEITQTAVMDVGRKKPSELESYRVDEGNLLVGLSLNGDELKLFKGEGIQQWAENAFSGVLLILPEEASFVVVGTESRGFGEQAAAGLRFTHVLVFGRPALRCEDVSSRDAGELLQEK